MNFSAWNSLQVVVRAQSGDSSDKDLIFGCGRWLDDHEEDDKTERELQLSGAKSLHYYLVFFILQIFS